jgi:hypothetical protein
MPSLKAYCFDTSEVAILHRFYAGILCCGLLIASNLRSSELTKDSEFATLANNHDFRHQIGVISLLLDKSAFQRIAELTPEQQVPAWNHLHTHFQVVIPSILVEEVVINFADPGSIPATVVRDMMTSLLRLETCWMDDVFEIAFRELVEQEPATAWPLFPPEFVGPIRTLSPGNTELMRWAQERRVDREAVVQTRMAAQDKLLPREARREMSNEAEFWNRLKNQFLKILESKECCAELLEVVLGETFRARHPERGPEIDVGFARFGSETFTRFYVSLSILMVRLAYMYAPLVHFRSGSSNSVWRFIGRSSADQRNNAADEQYIVAAMICNRLVTRDEGMKNVIEIFRLNGFTRCETIYLRTPVIEQILGIRP